MKVTTKIHGFREIDAVLRDLPPAVHKNVLATAGRAGARVIQREVKTNTPIGDEPSEASRRYGSAKENVSVIALRKIKKAAVGFRVSMGKAFWMTWYEFGNSRQPARPFFRPAAERASGPAVKAFIEFAAKSIERQAQKLAQKFGALRTR